MMKTELQKLLFTLYVEVVYIYSSTITVNSVTYDEIRFEVSSKRFWESLSIVMEYTKINFYELTAYETINNTLCLTFRSEQSHE